MTSTKLILSVAAVSCLLLSVRVHSGEPGRHSGVRARESHLQLMSAETNVKEHELELKMAELAVKEAALETDKFKLHLQAIQEQGDPRELAHVKLELKQADVRVEMKRVQLQMVRLRVERAMAELKFTRAASKEGHHETTAGKLKAAVEAGELTEKEAWAKWKAIQQSPEAKMITMAKEKAARARHQPEKAVTDAYFRQVWAKLQAAVRAGKMSAQDAEDKMIAIKKAKLGRGKMGTDYEGIARKLKAAVQAGNLTEDEAEAKWAAIKKAARGEKADAKDKRTGWRNQ
jgi:hypothetical protein